MFIAFSEPFFEKNCQTHGLLQHSVLTWDVGAFIRPVKKMPTLHIKDFGHLHQQNRDICNTFRTMQPNMPIRHHFCFPSKKHWGPKAFRKQQEEALLKMQAPFPCTLGTAASPTWKILTFFSGDEGTEAEREAAEEAAGERQLGTTRDKI